MPRILVGIPTLNRPDFVRQAVESVRAQSMRDWRIVVSDNASRPEAAAAVRAYVEGLGDPRIEYSLRPKNIREYGNCEWLFGQCREEYFVILHDDDLLDPAHLETALRRLDDNPGVIAFFSNARLVDTRGEVSQARTDAYRRARRRERFVDGPVRILEPLLESGCVSICGTVIRSRALQESGFVDEDCFGLWPFEVNLLLRLGERDGTAWFETRDLVRYRFHEGQMQRYQGISADPVGVGMLLNVLGRRRYSGRAERLRRHLLSMFHHFRARIAVRRGDLRACRRSLLTAIRINPWWVRHWPFAACAFLVPPLTPVLVRMIDSRPPREL